MGMGESGGEQVRRQRQQARTGYRKATDEPPGDDVDIEFKWNDNMQENGNIMDFYVNGDTAPGGRFNYVYTTNRSK